jgi:hypothetical protein
MATKHAGSEHEEAITRDVIDTLRTLDAHGKREVLAFSRDLARRRRATGPGGAFLAFAGAIPADDLELMERAIADGCETVDPAAW